MTSQPFPATAGYAGSAWFQSGGSPLNAMSFLVRRIIAGKAFAAVVTVQSVTNAGGISPVGTVSVQPMVGQVDGFGNIVPHGTIYNLPYFRLQGGTSAIIIDPVIGDIGMVIMCDRDISTVKVTKKAAGPGSSRENSWSDGMYFGGFLNGTPSQYVACAASGISIVTPHALTFSSSNCTLDAAGNLTTTGNVTAGAGGGDSVTLQGHRHAGVQTGGGSTAAPTAGT